MKVSVRKLSSLRAFQLLLRMFSRFSMLHSHRKGILILWLIYLLRGMLHKHLLSQLRNRRFSRRQKSQLPRKLTGRRSRSQLKKTSHRLHHQCRLMKLRSQFLQRIKLMNLFLRLNSASSLIHRRKVFLKRTVSLKSRCLNHNLDQGSRPSKRSLTSNNRPPKRLKNQLMKFQRPNRWSQIKFLKNPISKVQKKCHSPKTISKKTSIEMAIQIWVVL